MPRSDLRDLRSALFASLAFLAAAAFVEWVDGPAVVLWLSLALGGVGILSVIVRLRSRPMHDVARVDGSAEGVVLRDGREYRVTISDVAIQVTHKRTSGVETVPWTELTEVHALAIDGFPIGAMSFTLHRDATVVEVPSDTEGNEAFLAALQQRLSGFDNEALIAVAGTLHGHRRLWKRP